MESTSLTPDFFEAHIGAPVVFFLNDEEISLTLTSVTIRDHIAMRDNALMIDGAVVAPRVPFSVVFRGPVHKQLISNSYLMSLSDQEQIYVFLSPYAVEGDTVLYEAAFN